VNGGRGYADTANWEHDEPPVEGLHVWAADGGSERLEAVIAELRTDGTLVLLFPKYLDASPRSVPDPLEPTAPPSPSQTESRHA
jgi:hypothetical protein